MLTGPWANTPIMTLNDYDDDSTSHVSNSYGYLRAPWNTNNNPFVARYNKTLEYETDVMPSGHYLSGIAEVAAVWNVPLLVCVFVSAAILVVQFVVPQETLNALGYGMRRRDIAVDEDLPNFFDVLKPQQAYQMIAEAANMREQFAVEIMDEAALRRLGTMQWPAKTMQGTPFYDILSNRDYADQFCYIGAHVPEREKLLEDGDDNDEDNTEQADMVQILLNLGAVSDNVVRAFDFKSGFSRAFGEAQLKHQRAFEGKYGIRFEFENERLRRQYATFKRSRQSLSENLQWTTARTADAIESHRIGGELEMQAPGSDPADMPTRKLLEKKRDGF